MTLTRFTDHLKAFPFIAITRGIQPEEAVECASLLFSTGFRIIETPLNSPEPYRSIQLMANLLREKVIIGAGTVTRPEEVEQVRDAGGRIIVSPHCDLDLIKHTKHCGLLSVPGVATPTEAFRALQAGADALKLFPAETIRPNTVRSLRAVLPSETLLIPVGSISTDNWQDYMQAGASGFGLGSSLYTKKMSLAELQQRAQEFTTSWHLHQQQHT